MSVVNATPDVNNTVTKHESHKIFHAFSVYIVASSVYSRVLLSHITAKSFIPLAVASLSFSRQKKPIHISGPPIKTNGVRFALSFPLEAKLDYNFPRPAFLLHRQNKPAYYGLSRYFSLKSV